MNKVELNEMVGGVLNEKFNNSLKRVQNTASSCVVSCQWMKHRSHRLQMVMALLILERHRVNKNVKKALEYLIGLSTPYIDEIHGDVYSDKQLYRIDTYYPRASELSICTLTGLIDYIKSNTDKMDEKMIVEVSSPTKVRLYSQLDPNRNRELLMEVNAMIPDFDFDSFYGQESFCIGLQSKFINTKDKGILLKFAGTVESGTIAQYGDDGISQKATIKTGLASKGEALIPNPVKLKPYRTFLEVEQPESEFIFRMSEKHGVCCALFEADGGAWKMEAMQNIKAYLQEQLEDLPQFTVIA